MTYLVLEVPEEGLYEYLAKVQDAVVDLAVVRAGGNLSEAARLLRVCRQTLVYSLLYYRARAPKQGRYQRKPKRARRA